MNDLLDAARPPCHHRPAGLLAPECGAPVLRVEARWELNGDGDWVPAVHHTVCRNGHRVLVEFP